MDYSETSVWVVGRVGTRVSVECLELFLRMAMSTAAKTAEEKI